jgi:hypothetical protein
MKQITAYETRDGKIFTDQEEAAYHEGFLDQHQIIERCLDEFKHQGSAQRSVARQAIHHWEQWRHKNAIE